MAKTKGPLFGFRARGQLGKSLVFADWRGVSYARQLVTPSNPNTEAQQDVRGVFAYLNELWKLLPSAVQEVWAAYARGKPFTDRNALLSYNVPVLRGQSEVTNIVISPGVLGGPNVTSLNAAPGGVGEINVSVTLPLLPSGWSVRNVVYCAIRQQDPHELVVSRPVGLIVEDSPYSGVIGGLEPGEGYVVAAFASYVRQDGKVAYGPSINTLAIAGA